jgi:hypothetical protein
MKKLTFVAGVLLAMVFMGSIASAENFYLNDWLFYVNGAIYNPDPLPANFDATLFDFSQPDSAMGTISAVFAAAGHYDVVGFFDYEIEGDNNPLDNEIGMVHNLTLLGAGQSYELGFGEDVSPGVVDDALAGTLTNTNTATTPQDVAMAMGWSFDVASGTTVTLTFALSKIDPGVGFYLQQADQFPTGGPANSFYYSSGMTTQGAPPPGVPEPGTLLLLGSGLAVAFVGLKMRR